jgi:CheY-like chemotaxis protein
VGVERAARLTRQLLVFGRRDVTAPQPIDVNETVEGVSSMLTRLLPESISVHVALTPDLPVIRADRSQVEQIVVNLAVNARDAMPTGGALTIETEAVDVDDHFRASHPEARLGPHVLISVGDTGSGIAPGIADHIFEPFFTTKPVDSGTGLGLATCYAIAKQHNGFITMFTEVGCGTVFKVYLPEYTRGAEPRPWTPSASESPGGGETILLCEDDPSVRRVACRSLQEAGYNVLLAEHGAMAQSIAQRHSGPIHLLVTDVVLPGMSGRQLADGLALTRPETRILFVSGYTANLLAQQRPNDDKAALLPKPYTRRSLLAKVRNTLDGAT